MKANNYIPKEHQLKCPGCGKILDMRDPSCLAHGWIENGKILCHEEEEIPYTSSKEVGKAVEWTKNKKRIDLN